MGDDCLLELKEDWVGSGWGRGGYSRGIAADETMLTARAAFSLATQLQRQRVSAHTPQQTQIHNYTLQKHALCA